MEMKLYLYNSWHNGDVITNRCLVQKLIASGIADRIVLGSYRNRHYLVADLPVEHVVVPIDEDRPSSPCLVQWCPKGCLPVNTWCGTFPDLDHRGFPLGAHNWANVADTWNRQSDCFGVGVRLDPTDVPMVSWDHPHEITIPENSVYVETGEVRSGHSNFVFDMPKIAGMFPHLHFFCTSDQPDIGNVTGMGGMSLVEMSQVSDHCTAIVGKGSGPFLCTLTEGNRNKKKAVVGFTSTKFWDYPGNPLQYLAGKSDLLDFLKAVHT